MPRTGETRIRQRRNKKAVSHYCHPGGFGLCHVGGGVSNRLKIGARDRVGLERSPAGVKKMTTRAVFDREREPY